MSKELGHNIRLGIFVLIGIVLLTVGLYFIGKNRNMFGKTITLYASFKDVGGLQNGNNVRYAGIVVGVVEKITIVNDTTITVEMSVDADLKKAIRKDSKATLGRDGLMGSQLINIAPGTPGAPFVNTGDKLLSVAPVNTDEMLRTLEITNKNLAVVSENIKKITDEINNGRGTLYTVLNDTTLAGQIKHAVGNIDAVSNNVLVISDNLSDVVQDVKSGKGIVGTLMRDTVMTADLAQTLKDLKITSEQVKISAGALKEILDKINTGSGTAATLINDTASSNHLKQTLVNVEKSTKNFNDLMEALKHNILFKGYFKKQEKKAKAVNK